MAVSGGGGVVTAAYAFDGTDLEAARRLCLMMCFALTCQPGLPAAELTYSVPLCPAQAKGATLRARDQAHLAPRPEPPRAILPI